MNSFLCFCCFILLALFCSNGNAYENSVGRSRSFLPSLLVSAATTGNDGRKARAKHRTIQPNRRKNKDLEQGKSDEDSDQEEEDGDDDAGVQWTNEYLDTKQRVTDKLKCKYRKSCYEGVDPPVEEPKTADNEIQKDDKEQQKLSCKYRYSCYAEKWPNLLSEKGEKHKQKAASILISKPSSSVPPSATYKKPASLKKIAQQTLKELEEKELQNSQHPRPKHSHAKQKLMDAKEALEHKNKCKYRKSCYENGELPELKRAPYNETEEDEQEEDDDEPKNKVRNFEEMSTLEQKLFCKYRFSCYPNGVPPKIPEETKFKGIKEIVKPVRREIPLVLRCKYRKSCYETGVLPDLNPQKSEEHKKSKPKPVPTTVEELKLQCKYRKSCYINKAQQSSSEQDTPSAPIPTNVTETVAKPRPSTPQRRTAQPKSYSRQTKQDELPITLAKETTKEFCDHQEDIKGEAEMAVKLQQKKDKKASIMAEKMVQQPPVIIVVHDEPEEPENVEEIPELAVEMPIVEGEPEEILEEVPEEEASEEPETPEESTNLPLLSKAECKYRKSCYKTGKLIINDQKSTVKPPKVVPHTEMEMTRASLRSKLDCKYRKSCYQDQQIGQQEDESEEVEDKEEKIPS
uniref:Uncharacterized protein n=1 Tax=Ditylenchus dipsaci TaxID=166011 RepID=A0A915D3M2_9BILA